MYLSQKYASSEGPDKNVHLCSLAKALALLINVVLEYEPVHYNMLFKML